MFFQNLWIFHCHFSAEDFFFRDTSPKLRTGLFCRFAVLGDFGLQIGQPYRKRASGFPDNKTPMKVVVGLR